MNEERTAHQITLAQVDGLSWIETQIRAFTGLVSDSRDESIAGLYPLIAEPVDQFSRILKEIREGEIVSVTGDARKA